MKWTKRQAPRRFGLGIAVAAGLWTMLACSVPMPQAVPSEELILTPVAERNWPDLRDDMDADSFGAAAALSLDYLRRFDPGQRFAVGGYRRTAAELVAGTERLAEILSAEDDVVDRNRALQREFVLLRSIGRDGRGEVLLTGYYEPLLDAQREPDEIYRYPVYKIPDDLIMFDLSQFSEDLPDGQLVGRLSGHELIPYPNREAIDWDAEIADSAAVIAYVDDQIEVFFLHIQGSGTLQFADGTMVRAGYAGKNGHPYRSIGRLLLDDGLMTIDEMSMQAIKAYLESHPEEVRRVLTHNPSYVFFRELATEGGPLGCYELPLIAGRSIATDRRLFPVPIAGWLAGSLPDREGEPQELRRWVVNHDTGGAIRGPGRVDLFFGRGDEAGELAGQTKHLGELYFLLPKR
ncbi:MAG: transglycosylase [bacterium]|nr:transglycosylase [bacterium]